MVRRNKVQLMQRHLLSVQKDSELLHHSRNKRASMEWRQIISQKSKEFENDYRFFLFWGWKEWALGWFHEIHQRTRETVIWCNSCPWQRASLHRCQNQEGNSRFSLRPPPYNPDLASSDCFVFLHLETITHNLRPLLTGSTLMRWASTQWGKCLELYGY